MWRGCGANDPWSNTLTQTTPWQSEGWQLQDNVLFPDEMRSFTPLNPPPMMQVDVWQWGLVCSWFGCWPTAWQTSRICVTHCLKRGLSQDGKCIRSSLSSTF